MVARTIGGWVSDQLKPALLRPAPDSRTETGKDRSSGRGKMTE